MSAKTNYLENKIIDWFWRGQSFTPPTDFYFALFTVAPTDAGGGTEVAGGNYSRVQVAASLANWAGTQGAGTTAVSSGTSGTTSNNNAVTFPTPSGNWGQVVAVGIFDAAVAGNLLTYGTLTNPKNVNNGDPGPVFNAGTFTFQEDN